MIQHHDNHHKTSRQTQHERENTRNQSNKTLLWVSGGTLCKQTYMRSGYTVIIIIMKKIIIIRKFHYHIYDYYYSEWLFYYFRHINYWKGKLKGKQHFLVKYCVMPSVSCYCCKDVAVFQCKCMQESRMRYLEAKKQHLWVANTV